MGPESYNDPIQNIASTVGENFTLNSELAQQFIQANPDLVQLAFLLAINHTYLELLDLLISEVNQAAESNRKLQDNLKLKLLCSCENGSNLRRADVSMPCWPPYFKDSDGMAPNMNNEALIISRICSVDPLLDDERRWNPTELEFLRVSVCTSLKDGKIALLNSEFLYFLKFQITI